MTEIFKMPDIGEGMAEGEISHWLVKEGDTIKVDDEVAEVQNDKMMQEILSPYAGTITKLFVPDGTTVAVGDPLIEFDGDGTGTTAEPSVSAATDSDSVPTTATSEAMEPSKEATVTQTTATGASVASNGNVLAMPAVRHYAFEHQIDLTQVPATGHHGHITLADVQGFNGTGVEPGVEPVTPVATKSESSSATKPMPTVAPVHEGRQPMTPIRKAIAKAMEKQHEAIPAVTNFDQVEVSKLVSHRKNFKTVAADQEIRLTYLAYVIKALATTARKFPELNASVDMDTHEIVYHDDINMGVAVNAPSGLFVPVIAEADHKSIFQIAQEVAELAEAVREGTIKPQQMQGATITISNIGSARGTWFTPIINNHEVAILGLGSIVKEPIVNEDGGLAVGQNMKLSLTYDHRLIDGMLGQTAMNYLKKLLADPAYMLMEV